MFGTTLSHISAEACVPEQLAHYVRAVSGRRGLLCGKRAVFIDGRHAVLVAYPPASELNGPDAALGSGLASHAGETAFGSEDCPATARDFSGSEDASASALNVSDSRTAPDSGDFSVAGEPAAVREFPAVPLEDSLNALRERSCESVTVLAPFIPLEAPPEARETVRRDWYWQVPLPMLKAGAKLRNMLLRAERDIQLRQESWSGDHAELVELYLRSRPLAAGTRAVFSSLGNYVNGVEGAANITADSGTPSMLSQGADTLLPPAGNVLLLAARRVDGRLAGFAVGDYTALDTAFYMFAFRAPDAPPGTADKLLAGLVRHAEQMGHRRMNLGLGINAGIGFFKKKWNALPFLPYVETSWQLSVPARSGGGLGSMLRQLLRKKP